MLNERGDRVSKVSADAIQPRGAICVYQKKGRVGSSFLRQMSLKK